MENSALLTGARKAFPDGLTEEQRVMIERALGRMDREMHDIEALMDLINRIDWYGLYRCVRHYCDWNTRVKLVPPFAMFIRKLEDLGLRSNNPNLSGPSLWCSPDLDF